MESLVVEEWKDVVDYEELFQVSNLGGFYSKRTDKKLKQFELKNGYMTTSTKIGGRKGTAKCFRVHREVAKAFLEEPTDSQLEWAESSYYKKVYVNHIDGDKSNNSVSNLEWCTASENSFHHYNVLLGGNIIRNKPITAKLSDEQVLEVRRLANTGLSEGKISRIFGVSRTSIFNAKNGYSWVA